MEDYSRLSSRITEHKNSSTVRSAVYSRVAEGARRTNDLLFSRLNLPMPSTSRTVKQYKSSLFPDCESEDQMHELLGQGDTLDAGSGVTHKNPYSLFNHQRASGKMVSIDQRISNSDSEADNFPAQDLFANRIMIAYKDMKRVLTGNAPKRDFSTTNTALGADLREIPYDDASFKQILSMFCFPYWIDSTEDAAKIFNEFDRVLQPEGQMRFCASQHRTGRSLFDVPQISKAIADSYNVDIYEPRGLGGFTNSIGHSTLVLTKDSQ